MKTKMIFVFSRHIYFYIRLALVFLFLSQFVFSQTTRSHVVTVNVVKVVCVSVTPATINTLNIPGGATAVVTAGVDQMTVTDQTTLLKWGTNVSLTKISMSSSLNPQQYILQALVISPPIGTANNVTVSNIDQDLWTSIGPSSGSVNVRYTGIVLASQGIGTGSDVHPITFTISAP